MRTKMKKSPTVRNKHICFIVDMKSDSGSVENLKRNTDSEVIPDLLQFNKLKMFKAMNHIFDQIRVLTKIKKESMNNNVKLVQELESLKTVNESMIMKLKELQDKKEKANLMLFGFNVKKDA